MNNAILCFCLMGLPFGLATLAVADSETGPVEYSRAVGKRYVFVMLPPISWRQFGTLHKKYPRSGLYMRGSTVPLWTVDWYADEVEVSADGEHLVRFGPWPKFDEYKTLALAFYRKGKQIKQFSVVDLVSNPRFLPFSISHYQWLRWSYFSDERKRLTVVTYKGWGSGNSNEYGAGKRYTFDITTGKIVNPVVSTRAKK